MPGTTRATRSATLLFMAGLLTLSTLILVNTSCSRRPPPNVLLITLDTTRADAVGWATGNPELTPMLDALASRGTWFSQAFTAQPLTLPAHTTIMTGQYPPAHGVRNNGTYVAGPQLETLAEQLQRAGYRTHAVVSAFVLDSQFGLDQGFDSYDDDLSGGPRQKMFMFKETKADLTTLRAVQWLRQAGAGKFETPPTGKTVPVSTSSDPSKPFFLWVHYFDPHADYEPPAEIAQKFPRNPYFGEIHFADREIGRLLKELESTKQLENTLVVMTSDHGDGLGEHGERTHGIFVYDSTTHVPLLMSGPGVPVGKRVDEVVRTADLYPTLLEVLGLPKSAAPLDGVSVTPLWNGTFDHRLAYSETLMPRQSFGWSELRALRSQQLKAIQAPIPELYNMPADPHEQANRYTPGALTAEETGLFRELETFKANDPFARGEQQQVSLTGEMQQKMAALGYVSGGAPVQVSGPLPDPKERIRYWDEFQRTQDLVRQGRHQEALLRFSALLEHDPDNVLARGSMAGTLVKLGQRDQALKVYDEMIARQPTMHTPYLSSAALLRKLGRFSEAESRVRKVLELQPDNPDAYAAMGDVFLDQEKLAEAEPWFRRAVEKDPRSSIAATGLSNCLNREGRQLEALKVLEQSWKRDPTSYAVAYNLAVVNERLENDQAALDYYRAAIQLEPDESMAWNNLGSLLERHKKSEDALKAVRQAVELDPENLEAVFNLGSLLLSSGDAQAALQNLDMAIRLNPKFMPAYLRKAQALEKLGPRAAGLRFLEEQAAFLPRLWVPVARQKQALGDTEGARAALAQAMKLAPQEVRVLAERDPELKRLL